MASAGGVGSSARAERWWPTSGWAFSRDTALDAPRPSNPTSEGWSQPALAVGVKSTVSTIRSLASVQRQRDARPPS